MKQLNLLMALLVISSSPLGLHPPSTSSRVCSLSLPSRLRPPLRLCPLSPRRIRPLSPPPSPPSRRFSPLSPPLQFHPPPGPQPRSSPLVSLETRSPPEPPDPPDPPFDLVYLLFLNTAFSQQFSKTLNWKSPLLVWRLWSVMMSFLFAGALTGFPTVSFPASSDILLSRSLFLSWCLLVQQWVAGSSPLSSSLFLARPLTQILFQSFDNLLLGDELISLAWYLRHSRDLSLSLALVVLNFFYVQLWQLNGLMRHTSIRHVNWVLLNVYCPVYSVMEFVLFQISSSTLCGFGAGNVLLKIRDSSNTEVLIKGFLDMLKIVDCALVAASFAEFTS